MKTAIRFCLNFFLGSFLLLFGNLSNAQHPAELAGTLIVLNKNGHDASFIDLASGELLATLPTGRGPHELILSRDGRWAVGTDYSGGNSLTVFDVENLAVARTIDLSEYPSPHGIMPLPNPQEVVVTSEASQNLLRINFVSGAIEEVIPTQANGSHMVAVSQDGSMAVTSNMNSDSVSVINLELGQLEKQLSVPDRPEAITINKAGSEFWVGSNDEATVTVYGVSEGEQLAQWEGFSWPYRILLSNDEKYAVIPDLGQGIMRFFDVTTRVELGRMNFAGAAVQGVSWYHDDRTLFLSISDQNKVLVIDVESRRILGEYAAGDGPDGIVYSPLVLRKNVNYQ